MLIRPINVRRQPISYTVGWNAFVSFPRMAALQATISGLQITDQQLICKVNVDGANASAMMIVYDAGGTERARTDLGTMEAGQSWDLTLDVLGGGLEDGDYGAWIYVFPVAGEGTTGNGAEQGVSFLVGRGEVYPSREAADKRHFDTPVECSNLRLEGSWVVFDMKNTSKVDVEAAHSLMITNGTAAVHHANGEELVRAGATQQGHYLLPEQMENGRYTAVVVVQAQGSDAQVPALMNIDVDDNVVTIAP